MIKRWRQERGSVSTAIGVMIFLPILAFAMAAMRIVQMNGDVGSAARAGARAASLTYTPGDATEQTEDVVTDVLADRGVNCQSLVTTIVRIETGANGFIVPGSTILIEVTCDVDLSQSIIAGFPGTRTITVQAVSQVDNLRGGGVFEGAP